ncbi:hypothetical protein HerbRD11066_41100 [Herbidospora sp. RD11066]
MCTGVPEQDPDPLVTVDVWLRAGNVRAIHDLVGADGFSAYVNAAVERRLRRDRLEERPAT